MIEEIHITLASDPHLKLYWYTFQLAESALLILMESRVFDASMVDESQRLYLDPKNITLVIKV